MNHKLITDARDRFRKLVYDEIEKEVLSSPRFELDFQNDPIDMGYWIYIQKLRWEQGRIIAYPPEEGDGEPCGNDLELYSIDDLLVISERVFPDRDVKQVNPTA